MGQIFLTHDRPEGIYEVRFSGYKPPQVVIVCLQVVAIAIIILRNQNVTRTRPYQHLFMPFHQDGIRRS